MEEQKPVEPLVPSEPVVVAPPRKSVSFFLYIPIVLASGLLFYILFFILLTLIPSLEFFTGYFPLLLIPIFSYVISSLVFPHESYGERILKSLLGLLFIVVLFFVIGFGFCLLLLRG